MAMRDRTVRKSKPSKAEIDTAGTIIYEAGPQALGLLAMLHEHRPGYDISGRIEGKAVGRQLRFFEGKGLVAIVPEITHSGDVREALPLFGARLTTLGRFAVKYSIDILYVGNLGEAMSAMYVDWCRQAMVPRRIDTRTKRTSASRRELRERAR